MERAVSEGLYGNHEPTKGSGFNYAEIQLTSFCLLELSVGLL